jgi:ABC-type nitrate/sulfonate/bicarbonate transport system permease component
MSMKNKFTASTHQYRWLGIVTIVLVVLLWIALTTVLPGHSGPTVEPLKLPGPMLVWQAAAQLRGNLIGFSLVTLLRVLVGLGLGAILGTATGLVMTRSRVITAILDPLIEGLRPCPPVALIPFIILWLGLGTLGEVAIIGLSCFMVTVVTIVGAVNTVDRRYVRAALSLGADMLSVYRTVIWPAIVPSLIGGLRVAAATAFGATVAAEYLGAQGGLGYMIRNARVTLDTESVLLGIILLGIESWLVDQGIRVLGNLSSSWQDRPFGDLGLTASLPDAPSNPASHL